jgi:hypothetical protein
MIDHTAPFFLLMHTQDNTFVFSSHPTHCDANQYVNEIFPVFPVGIWFSIVKRVSQSE